MFENYVRKVSTNFFPKKTKANAAVKCAAFAFAKEIYRHASGSDFLQRIILAVAILL